MSKCCGVSAGIGSGNEAAGIVKGVPDGADATWVADVSQQVSGIIGKRGGVSGPIRHAGQITRGAIGIREGMAGRIINGGDPSCGITRESSAGPRGISNSGSIDCELVP